MYSFMVSIFIYICMFININHARGNDNHPQTFFCKSDFAMLIVPRSVIFTTINSRYIVDVLDIYKNTKKAKKFIRNGLYINLTTMFDGFHFVLNNPYLVTGRVMKNRAYTGDSAYIKSYDEVAPYLKFAFKVLYQNGCPCQVRYCDNNKTCDRYNSKFNDICPADLRTSNNICYTYYGFCARDADGKYCIWKPTEELHQCLYNNVWL